MTKRACMSGVRDPENRSRKACVCGGHSSKAKNSKRSKVRRVKPRPNGFFPLPGFSMAEYEECVRLGNIPIGKQDQTGFDRYIELCNKWVQALQDEFGGDT